jgi:hypothetical protein
MLTTAGYWDRYQVQAAVDQVVQEVAVQVGEVEADPQALY